MQLIIRVSIFLQKCIHFTFGFQQIDYPNPIVCPTIYKLIASKIWLQYKVFTLYFTNTFSRSSIIIPSLDTQYNTEYHSFKADIKSYGALQ